MKKINKFIRNRKGDITPLSIAVLLIVAIIALAFFIDLMNIFIMNSAIEQTATEIARIGGVQGGFLYSAPKFYPGKYTNINEMQSYIDKKLSSTGIKTGKYKVSIIPESSGQTGVITSTSAFPTGEIPYKEEFTVRIEVEYEWDVSRLIKEVQRKGTERIGMSEWKYY